MKPKLILCLALVLSGVLLGCSSIAHAGASSSDTRNVVAGNTEFAVDLYGKLRTREGNVFFSPLQHLDRAGHDLWRGAGRD